LPSPKERCCMKGWDDPEVRAWLEEAASYLTGFAVVPRYPSFQPQTGDPSARSGRACALVREILREVLSALGA